VTLVTDKSTHAAFHMHCKDMLQGRLIILCHFVPNLSDDIYVPTIISL